MSSLEKLCPKKVSKKSLAGPTTPFKTGTGPGPGAVVVGHARYLSDTRYRYARGIGTEFTGLRVETCYRISFKSHDNHFTTNN